MKIKERRKRLQNKGFTLIELIVTIAIIAIFSGVVLTFITTGSNIYRSTSSSAKVQMETQETFDQIEELLIDVNRSMYYANGSGSSIGSEIKNDIKQDGAANRAMETVSIFAMCWTGTKMTRQFITVRESTRRPAALRIPYRPFLRMTKRRQCLMVKRM